MQTLEFRAMNTDVLLAAEGIYAAELGLQVARRFIEVSELRFSRFLPESELSQLNIAAGSWRMVSTDLLEMLQLSLAYHKETDGLFDPSILPDLKRLGYDRTMDAIRAKRGAVAPGLPRAPRPSFRDIEIDAANRRVRLQPGMEIDLGGFAKGWIVKKAAELLSRDASACAVSAGGDILFIGRPGQDGDWQVNIEDPQNPSAALAGLKVGPGAVATSSIAKRSWHQDGLQRHHLIDPRTGEPAKTSWLSVTVMSPDILTAEVYAKALLIGGAGEADHLASRRSDLNYIAIDTNGALNSSMAAEDLIYEHGFTYQQ
jgi:FAD:protein FMN transferase